MRQNFPFYVTIILCSGRWANFGSFRLHFGMRPRLLNEHFYLSLSLTCTANRDFKKMSFGEESSSGWHIGTLDGTVLTYDKQSTGVSD